LVVFGRWAPCGEDDVAGIGLVQGESFDHVRCLP
jgi:hypothetical protein